MKRFLLIMIFCLLYVNGKLIYVYAIIRHGSIYPKTNMYRINVRPDLQAKLTVMGMRQQYNMGSYLRRDYIVSQGLTSGSFNRTEVEFYASEMQRTSLSVLCVMQGMYPLGTGPNISNAVPKELLQPPYEPLFPNGLQTQVEEISFALKRGFQPIGSTGIDYMLDHCDNYQGLLNNRLNTEVSEEMTYLNSTYFKAMQRIGVIFNLTKNHVNILDLKELFKVIGQSRGLGLPLPAAFTQEDQNALHHIYCTQNVMQNRGTFARAAISPFLNFMHNKIEAVLKGTTHRKMGIVSIHQSNAWPIMFIFNLTSPLCVKQQEEGIPPTELNCVDDPYFSTSFIFEVHEDEDQHRSVKLRYNGEYVHLCEREDYKCPADDFLARLANSTIEYSQLCKLPPGMSKPVHIAVPGPSIE